jgi:hypothetical protein
MVSVNIPGIHGWGNLYPSLPDALEPRLDPHPRKSAFQLPIRRRELSAGIMPLCTERTRHTLTDFRTARTRWLNLEQEAHCGLSLRGSVGSFADYSLRP